MVRVLLLALSAERVGSRIGLSLQVGFPSGQEMAGDETAFQAHQRRV